MKLTIRSKLLMISVVLLLVPWLGVQYIQDMEDFLRKNQESDLLDRTRIVAALLQNNQQIFRAAVPTTEPPVSKLQQAASHIYMRPLNTPMQLDGYLDDWIHYEDREQRVVSDQPASLSYRSYMGMRGRYLYMMILVRDDHLVYRKGNRQDAANSDHIEIVLADKHKQLRHYYVSTISPGWVNAHQLRIDDEGEMILSREKRIRGEWQETVDGYNVELRIPLSMVGDRLSVFVADVDDETTREVTAMIGSAPSIESPGSLVVPSAEVESVLGQVVKPASRTWVVDSQYRVLAVADKLKQLDDYQANDSGHREPGVLDAVSRIFYQYLLKQPTGRFEDMHSSASFFHGKAVQSALEGRPAVSWRSTPDDRVRILTASYPVFMEGKSIGAVAIEETSNTILILQNRTMEILINLSVIGFFITVAVLLGFATMLSMRIRKLRDQAEAAIGDDGKLLGNFRASNSTDEIGDLSREFGEMLARLTGYNRYLESMASKLSHELRTPVTVVSSSLENLQSAENDSQRKTYIDRAREGMDRLSNILTRMSEATRLEQTLQSEQLEQINLCQLVSNCVEAYRIANPGQKFTLHSNDEGECDCMAAPELLAQMLDKLVSNAIDFHEPGSEIRIYLQKTQNYYSLVVANTGPALPEGMQDNLFESMVSMRVRRDSQPHLGLGLFIVRMITEFHKGKVYARNAADQSGVEFEVRLPVSASLS